MPGNGDVNHAETRGGGGAGNRPRRGGRSATTPRLILAGIGPCCWPFLIALLAIANGTSQFSPDFLSEFVLLRLVGRRF